MARSPTLRVGAWLCGPAGAKESCGGASSVPEGGGSGQASLDPEPRGGRASRPTGPGCRWRWLDLVTWCLGRLGIRESFRTSQVWQLMHKNSLTQSRCFGKNRELTSTAVRILSWRRRLVWSTDDFRQLGTMCRSLGRPRVAARLAPAVDSYQASITPLVGLRRSLVRYGNLGGG